MTFGPQPPVRPSPEAMSFPHARPTPYQRMLRTWTYEWWKPVVGLLIAVLGFFVVAALVFFGVGAAWAAFQSGSWAQDVQRNIDPNHVTPASLLGTNLGLAAMIPLTWFIVRVVHRLRPRWLGSVGPGLRWWFLVLCLGLAVVALVAQILVGTVLPGAANDLGTGHLNHFTGATAASAVVIVLTTPLQAAGEEYLFRGYLLQAICSLVPREGNKWVGITVSAALFAFAHGGQNPPLFFDRFAFGLIAAWLVTRTGGLEAGIALHILNNFLAFGLALAFGDLTSTLTVSQVSWWNIVLTVTQSGVYTLLVVWVARRHGLQTRTRPPHVEPDTSYGPAAATA
jgi:uncharacterized protein